MTNKKLRYDLVVEAMSSLRRYVDSCAEETNTMALIADAGNAIKQLKAKESGLKQIHEPDRPCKSNVLSALAEAEVNVEKVKEKIEFIETFMQTYGEDIQVMKQVIATSYVMSEMLAVMRGLDRHLKELQRRTVL